MTEPRRLSLRGSAVWPLKQPCLFQGQLGGTSGRKLSFPIAADQLMLIQRIPEDQDVLLLAEPLFWKTIQGR